MNESDEDGELQQPRLTHLAEVLIQHGLGEGGRHSARKIARLAGISHEQISRMLRPRAAGEPPYPWRPQQLHAVAQALRETGEIVTDAALEWASLRDLGYTQAATGDSLSAVLERLPDLSDTDRRLVLAQLVKYLSPEPDGDR